MKLGSPAIQSKRPSFIRRSSSSILFFTGMATLGFLAQFQWLGHILIGLYVIIALLRHIPVRLTFIAALLMLGVVPIGVILTNWTVAQNFGAYSFVLFVFGAAQITLEERRRYYVRSRNDNKTA